LQNFTILDHLYNIKFKRNVFMFYTCTRTCMIKTITLNNLLSVELLNKYSTVKMTKTSKYFPYKPKSNNQEIIGITSGLSRPRNLRGRIGAAYKFEPSIPSSALLLACTCASRGWDRPFPSPFRPPVGFMSGTLVKGVRHTHPKKEEESVDSE